jgi:uncharacterized membrane-anchored protein
MRFSPRRHALDGLPGVTGTVRMDRRTGSLLRRLRPGDIAVIDHLDLDRATAEALVERGVVAVLNASAFISGRYPNLGPEVLAGSGVVLLDELGPEVFTRLQEGSEVRIHEGAVLRGTDEVASGRRLEPEDVRALMQDARSGLSAQLQSFTHDTTEYLRREEDLLLHGQGVPDLDVSLTGRPVVVVVRDYDYREDLRRLRRFVREQRPVLVGVDAGADALLAAGHRPDIVLVGQSGLAQATAGDQQGAVSDKALRVAREIVLHTDRSGHATGAERLGRLGLRYRTLAASGTSEDVALLLADARGAALIIAVGTHATLDEFLDRQRAGLASTFLTRLRVGPKLVDAKGVPQLYAGRVRLWHLAVVLLAGFLALAVALAATPTGSDWSSAVHGGLSDVLHWIQGLFS